MNKSSYFKMAPKHVGKKDKNCPQVFRITDCYNIFVKFFVFFLFIFLQSCSQRIKVPVNRMMSPEAIGRGAKVSYRKTGYSQGILQFTNNDTDNPLVMSTTQDNEFYMGLGISQEADLFIRVPEESSSLIGLKVQIMGAPAKANAAGHSLAFTLAMGSERDEFEDVFTIDLKSDVRDYAFLHGYRMSPLLLLYDGVSLTNFRFQGKVKGATGLNSNIIDYSAKNILGAFGGVILGAHDLNLTVEAAAQVIEGENTEKKTFQQFAVSLSGGW